MLLADDLAQRIAEQVQEVFIGCQDFARWREFDDGLDARDCVELSGVLDGLEFRSRDIGGDLDDLHGALSRKDRVVGRFDPDGAPPFAILRYCR